jgi:hypothetical protein
MSRKLVAALVAAMFVAAAPAAAQVAAAPSAGSALANAHTCGRGYTHAVIGGAHKCLRRGQYCARRYDSQYHRYGYHCHTRDRNGAYHLE